VRKLQRARNDHDDFLEKTGGTALASFRARRIAMPDVGERLDKVEQGLTELSQRMDERFAKVDQRFTQLQVLTEENASQIKLVAEVQAHHGTVLDQIKEATEPLKGLRPLFEQVAKDHEHRNHHAGAGAPLSATPPPGR
jgi:DNA repair ATPase RecN